MQLVSAKSAKDVPFPVEFVYADKAIVEVVIGKLRIRKGESYSSALSVLVEKPYTDAEKYRVTSKLDGFAAVERFFDREHEAKAACDDLASKGAEAVLERVTVKLNEDGEIVGMADGKPVKLNEDGEQIPF